MKKQLTAILTIQPTKKLIKWVLIWWVVVVLVSLFPYLLPSLIGFKAMSHVVLVFLAVVLALLFLVCLLDLICLINISKKQRYHIHRHYPSNVALNHDVKINATIGLNMTAFFGISRWLLAKFNQNQVDVQFSDEYPTQLKPYPNQMPIAITFDVQPHTQDYPDDIENVMMQVCYDLLPIQRGTGYFQKAWLKITSPLSFFSKKITIIDTNNQQHLRVLSDFSGLLSKQLSVLFEKQQHLGNQQIKQQGHGDEFFKLKEYDVGDAIRQIDWKSSSRLNRLMSKSYQDHNEQQIIFLLDCGEQMHHQNQIEQDLTQDTSYFDGILNTILLLSYVANRQNDDVGLMTFGGVEKYLPPSRGESLITKILNEMADIQPTMQTSDYLSASEQLIKYVKKRSLIVLISNTRQEASYELKQAIKLLSQRHEVLFANLIEQDIKAWLSGDKIPDNFDDALLYHSLVEHELIRQRLGKQLTQHGRVVYLNITANELPLKLINTYLSIRHNR